MLINMRNGLMAGGGDFVVPYISTVSLVSTGLPFGDASSFCELEMDFAVDFSKASRKYSVVYQVAPDNSWAGAWDIIMNSDRKLSTFSNGIVIASNTRYRTILSYRSKRIYGGIYNGNAYGGEFNHLNNCIIGLGSSYTNDLGVVKIFKFKYTYNGETKVFVPITDGNGFVCAADGTEITGSNWAYGEEMYSQYPEPQI